VAYITALDSLAQAVGAPRIVRGKAIVNVAGDPSLRPADERKFRKDMVAQALHALATPVTGPTILD
jgi:hypothetical protein